MSIDIQDFARFYFWQGARSDLYVVAGDVVLEISLLYLELMFNFAAVLAMCARVL